MPTPEEAEARLRDAIPAALPDLFVNRWVLMYEVLEPDGDITLCAAGSDGLKRWESMGMLTHELAIEQARVSAEEYDRDEDEDD